MRLPINWISVAGVSSDLGLTIHPARSSDWARSCESCWSGPRSVLNIKTSSRYWMATTSLVLYAEVHT